MRPKKQQIEAAKACGDLDKVSCNLSAAYLLVNVAVDLYMESQDILRGHGLVLGESKQKANRLQATFDDYIACFGSMVSKSNNDMNFAKDYDELRPALLRVLGIPAEKK